MTIEPTVWEDDGSDAFAEDDALTGWQQVRAAELREQADADDERMRIPPEYRGQTWGGSPFPPVHTGLPAEPFPPFDDFKNYAARQARAAHPERYCADCGQGLEERTIREGVHRCARCRIESGDLTQREWERQQTAWLKKAGRA